MDTTRCNYDEYVEDMSKDGTYGDELALQAFANLSSLSVRIISSTNGEDTARAALLGNALGVTATETTEVSVGSAAGPTTVAVGNESAGAAAEETTLGKLSRRQAKKIKHRMNKMKFM